MMTDRSLLVVEDSAEDMVAFVRAMGRLRITRPLHHCRTADLAFDYLHGLGAFSATGAREQRPSLILLDLNLPGTDGRDLLAGLKADEQTRAIPVVIFSTSTNPRDVTHCYEHGASGYLVKPMDFQDLLHTVRTLFEYWFGTATLLP